MPATGLMGADGQYPTANGVYNGMLSTVDASFRNPNLYKVNMAILGVPGTGASYTVQSRTFNGDWVNTNLTTTGNGAAATGSTSGYVSGYGIRINAVNGTTPGSGGNTPKYELEWEVVNTIPVRE